MHSIFLFLVSQVLTKNKRVAFARDGYLYSEEFRERIFADILNGLMVQAVIRQTKDPISNHRTE